MQEDKVLLAVNGTLMRGLALENNLKEVGASFIKESQTEKAYRLFSIDDKYPAMIKDPHGASIDVEVYELNKQAMEIVLSKEPEGLTIEKIKLIDNEEVYGVIGLDYIIKDRKEITSFGGWRNYMKSLRKLFIYYSYTGNGDVVAEVFKEKGYDIRKVETVKRLPKTFFWSMMVGGFQAGMKKKAKLKDFNYDVSDYDEVVIGSPIWNARFAPAINTVLANLKIENQKLAFVLYAGSGTGKKAEKRLLKEYPSAKYVFLKQPKDFPEELNRLSF